MLRFPLRGSVSVCLYIQATASQDYCSIEDKRHIHFVNRIVKSKKNKHTNRDKQWKIANEQTYASTYSSTLVLLQIRRKDSLLGFIIFHYFGFILFFETYLKNESEVEVSKCAVSRITTRLKVSQSQ